MAECGWNWKNPLLPLALHCFAASVLQHTGFDILLIGSKSSGGGLKTERTKGIMEEMAFRVSLHSPQGRS